MGSFRASRLCLAIVTAVSVSLSIAACGGVNDPSKNKNDDLTDDLDPAGIQQVTYAFNVAKNGEYSVQVIGLSNPNVTIGVAMGGLTSNNDCIITLGQNNLAKLNAVALSGAIDKANNYCLIVYNNGTLTAPVTYTVRLSHP